MAITLTIIVTDYERKQKTVLEGENAMKFH